ncbi:hypothetical protein Q4511_10595 [Paracoccus sp. 1_MG-2023]|uniref:hypothetical protein n=1 Tax=unclassified Paracoccus (in: a-proteobacteria) TaxID=2688777 RepID=UPI001C09EE32|nr:MULTISPECIES: hypothetical protein [unclassified Paracoccus (in: a-proteobacteria)]MBU2959088.1 hypothetical protein [Paracoccus sp. C2R09]MDO6669372.1 hypothetical protein [Paracoccus sp. 1_MG-2023]
MKKPTSKSIAIFSRPFTVPGFDEILPAGEYRIETELAPPPHHRIGESWKPSVVIKLHSRFTHPGLTRTLLVSLADLDDARVKDQLSERALSNFFVEEMLADPIVRLVMEADGVSEKHLRALYSVADKEKVDLGVTESQLGARRAREEEEIRNAENEGMPSLPESPPHRTSLE